MRIAIVGAGPSGIASARVFRALGHDVVVFEAKPDVGGVWSSTRSYPGLGLQTDKTAYAFIDQPMPRHYPQCPDGSQVQAYLAGYVRDCGLETTIELQTRVLSAVLLPEGQGWSMTVEGPAGARTEVADWLVMCNGMYSVPHIPTLSGHEDFERAGGQILSPSTTGDGEAFRDRDLVVLGWGKSAADLATHAIATARSVNVVARTISWKLPRRVGRIPWQRLVLTRIGEQILWTPRRSNLAVRTCLRALNPLRRWALRRIQHAIAVQLDLDRRDLLPTTGLGKFGELVTDGFFEAIDSAEVALHRQRTIVALGAAEGRPYAELSDGVRLSCDVLLAATGYDQDLSVFGAPVIASLVNPRGEMHLYRHTMPAGVPRLAFVGWHNSFHSPVSAQIQALWVAAAMHELVEEPTAWMRARYTSVYRLGHRTAETLHEPQFFQALGSIPDIDAWIAEAGLAVPRRVRLRELHKPLNPSDYAGLISQLQRRIGKDTAQPLKMVP